MSRIAKAWVSEKAGSELILEDVQLEALGPNGVEIQVSYCGVCGSDIHLLKSDGGYSDFTAYAVGKKQVCGHEVLGIVTNVGRANNNELKIGDYVGVGWQCSSCHNCEWCERGDEQLCPSVKCTCCEGNIGGFANYLRVNDSSFVFKIPKSLYLPATAPLLCGGQTVWTPLVTQTKKGDKIGILGLGGLGTMALMFAAKLGRKKLYAISGSPAKKRTALEMGANEFLNHNDADAMTHAQSSMDFILVTLSTQQKIDFSKFFQLLRPRGTICFVGMVPPITADVFTMGFTMHNITTSNTGGRKDMIEMLQFCATHSIGAPHVSLRPMDQVNQVIHELEDLKEATRFVLTTTS
mmetsp:Transcript_16940/g.21950  ORF Transcript_16940/g.21950 Transcript_16940/m.21950 type:complete len:351 (-) Transcript_16940:415-1467(-)|eukprot:CAMPEP_0197292872 /NCGR_PEP_ID=MMETSP0890-20130614/25562_1 /TAXON_ID=44058 ORGANISM="Aureoumbra lagunensis, Strain CCMP1510" /NCGR_SAMPLE_ID=MMETSP0890 /ASSEMBLY_ACC=CAM_ASM_000533 /LENGTH=350 /DNA_ID=CAMNT_0042767127 /DNA_START=179 /DNA_END=1231 /DNA_ORIENTATION=-